MKKIVAIALIFAFVISAFGCVKNDSIDDINTTQSTEQEIMETEHETTEPETTEPETTEPETTEPETTEPETTEPETTEPETIESVVVPETEGPIVVDTTPVEGESDNVPAAQIGDVTYDTFAEAVAAVKDEEKIVLLRNVYNEEDVVVNRVVWFFIDGNGFGYPNVVAGEGLTRRASGSPFNPYLGVYHFE